MFCEGPTAKTSRTPPNGCSLATETSNPPYNPLPINQPFTPPPSALQTLVFGSSCNGIRILQKCAGDTTAHVHAQKCDARVTTVYYCIDKHDPTPWAVSNHYLVSLLFLPFCILIHFVMFFSKECFCNRKIQHFWTSISNNSRTLASPLHNKNLA